MSEKEYDSGDLVGHYECIADQCSGKKDCGSSDAMACYEHLNEDETLWYDAHCYSCCQTFSKEELEKSSVGDELGIGDGSKTVEGKPKKLGKPKVKAEPLTKEQVKAHIKRTGYVSHGYRGITDETNRYFGHTTRLDGDGNVMARYYPETIGKDITGYKCRNHPKDFRYGKLGLTGLTCDLSGQIKNRKGGGKYLLLVGGCEDKAAAHQMLWDNQVARGQQDFEPVTVVSPTTGEGSAFKQVAAQYDWIDTFEIIVLGMDNDEAGDKAVQELIEVLPEDKVKVATWSGKDPNKMLLDGKHKQFLRDFYGAKDVVEDGIVSSVIADKTIEEELSRPKIKLPEFMSELEDMMAGGIPLGYWVNWIARTGIGKSTIINEGIRQWVYHSPYKVGILSLELTAPQYMIAMLSREVGKKINLIKDPQEAIDFVNQPHVQEARTHLREDEDGRERFAILDERDGTLKNVKKQIERLIKKHSCKLIIIDPINDLFDGSSWDEQGSFIKWMKNIIKGGVTFCCICHVNKGGATTDREGKRIERELSEDDVSGLSLLTKSAGANIFFDRNKYSDDPIIKNLTNVTVGKIRWTGLTGKAGSWIYDIDRHTMSDYNDYLNKDKSDDNPLKKIESKQEE